MEIRVHVPKANHTFVCDVESLPSESLAYIINYGATQSVVDTTAGVKRSNFKSDDDFTLAALEKAQKRWDQIVSGNVPGTRVKTPTKTVAEIVGALSDAELAKLGLVRAPVADAA